MVLYVVYYSLQLFSDLQQQPVCDLSTEELVTILMLHLAGTAGK